jgi:hypothetical protein
MLIMDTALVRHDDQRQHPGLEQTAGPPRSKHAAPKTPNVTSTNSASITSRFCVPPSLTGSR